MFYKRFSFAVSVCALFAVDAAWAAYSNADTTVTGLAGASYVAQLVNSAGQAANAAATAAANAQTSANSAANTAAQKVNIAQGSSYANKAVITNSSGNITTGTIASGMIATGAVTSAKIADATIATGDIADSAVTSAKIADGTIVNADIASTAAIATSKISGLATVATSGSYTDLKNKPTIPTVNNATLTIQKNGASVATFTANSGTAATANITVPTKTSQLTNDSNYATTTAVAAKLDKSLGADTSDMFLITDAAGTVVPVAVTESGTGTLVTDIYAKEGKLTVTKGASLPTVGTANLTIKNGATNTAIATFGANATSAKTATIPAATPTIAGLGKIGVIPSGSATSTTYATIWVE